MLFASIVFWLGVLYITFAPRTPQAPAMGPVTLRRQVRHGYIVFSNAAPASQAALPPRALPPASTPQTHA